jgi:hypothetical protein
MSDHVFLRTIGFFLSKSVFPFYLVVDQFGRQKNCGGNLKVNGKHDFLEFISFNIVHDGPTIGIKIGKMFFAEPFLGSLF